MASSILRRPLRLYIPLIAAVLICGFAAWLGVFEPGRRVWLEPPKNMTLHEYPPPKFGSLYNQTSNTMFHLGQGLNIWAWNENITPGDYDLHLWTIPVEFRCSSILFLVLIGTSRLQQHFRLGAVISVITYCVLTDRKDAILFLAGMLMAEIDMIIRSRNISLPGHTPKKPSFGIRSAWLTVFMAGLHCISAPVVGIKGTSGYVTLASLVPRTLPDDSFAVQSLGAILTTWAVANSEDIKFLFTNSFSQYLSKISFALYLVHGNVLKSLQYAMMPKLWSLMGGIDGPVGGWIFGWCAGMVIILPVTLWLADIFWRFIDIPSVRFAKWLEGVILAPWPDDGIGYHKP